LLAGADFPQALKATLTVLSLQLLYNALRQIIA
jgi:hypothetical protein